MDFSNNNELFISNFDEFYKVNSSMFYTLINRYYYSFVNYDFALYEREDMNQICWLKLMSVINKFDPNRTKIMTFAYYICSMEFNMILRKKKNLYISIYDEMFSNNNDGSTLSLIDILTDDKYCEEKILEAEALFKLFLIVNKMPEKHKKVLVMSSNNITQETIAEELNYSQSYISRLISKNQKTIQTKIKQEFKIELQNALIFIQLLKKRKYNELIKMFNTDMNTLKICNTYSKVFN